MLTLALGTGGATALFTVVYGVLLRPLPYRDADRLLLFPIERTYTGRAAPVTSNFSLADLPFWQERPRALASVALFANSSAVLSDGAGTAVVGMATVTGEFFSTIQGRILAGRPLEPGDDARPVAVISERLWRERFGARTSIVGERVSMDRQLYVVVGVADGSFQLPSPNTDAWRPAGFARTLDPTIARPRAGGFLAIARLRPRASVVDAAADCRAVLDAIAAADARAGEGMRGTAIPIRDQLVRDVRSALLILFAATGFVFAIACANVMSLVLVQQASQARERAIRAALGASRARLASQALVESAVVAAGGSAIGLAFASWTIAGLTRLRPIGLPRLDAVHLDWPVMGFALGIAAVSVFVIGLLPALQRTSRAQTTHLIGSRSAGAPSNRRTRRALTVFELAASTVLLVGTSLLGRSFVRLVTTDIGADIDQVTAAHLDVSYGRTLSSSDEQALVERIVDEIRRVPGIVNVGASSSVPPNRAMLRFTLNRVDEAVGQPTNVMVDAVTATPDYFRSVGLRLLAGRWFTDADDAVHPQVMILSRSTARELFGPGDPLGKRVTLPVATDYPRDREGHAAATLVGIVDDVKYSGMAAPPDGVIYRPFAQQPWPAMFIVARTSSPVDDLSTPIRHAIARVDRSTTVYAVESLASLVEADAAPAQFRTIVLALSAVLALALAAVGLYGVMAASVAQRASEFGIRLALGAAGRDVLRLVLSESLTLAAAGIAFGLGVAGFASRLLIHFLYGVPATDPISYISAALLLLVVALTSSYVPARTAVRLDPLTTLRSE